MKKIQFACILLSLPLSSSLLAQVSQPTELAAARFGGSPTGGDTEAGFALGMTLDDGQSYVTSAAVSQSVSLLGTFRPEPGHIGLNGDLFLVDRHNGQFKMRDQDGNFVVWNARVPDLVPYLENVQLDEALVEEVFEGILGTSGEHRLFIGFMPEGGVLYYTPFPLKIEITEVVTNPSLDVSGNWVVSDTVDARDCDEGISDDIYSATLQQNGEEVTITAEGLTRSGRVNAHMARFNISYPEDGGTSQADIFLFFDDDSFSGHSIWNWSGANMSCSGFSSLRGNRVTNKGQIDLSGLWNVNDTLELSNCHGDEINTTETYTAELEHEYGGPITITAEGITRTSGTVSTNTMSYKIIYPEDGGTTSSEGYLEFEPQSFSGMSFWTWSGDGNSCSGTTTHRGSRQ